ncbi:uncharacterized protein LOC115720173 [Cannabis sativa]|uniref:uncharacterized protein LOC115720173 n=1 Tax=Cannabis sativa TaxID=3483 RepID=UPI0029C9D536|nr:uncharacterized protein LOC115720173 [Cannabis sativa]
MEKAYDKMSWNFIGEVLGSMKFDEVFIRWVNKCIELKRMGLLLKGAVQGVISPTCVLRQEDSLSLALFIKAADVLSTLLMAKNEEGEIAGMKRMKKDSMYLGLPLFKSLTRSKDLNLLVDKVMQRVKSWKTRLLSKAGRACLIQSVGSSIATYVATSDVIPKTIARRVDKELRDFWWGDMETKKT